MDYVYTTTKYLQMSNNSQWSSDVEWNTHRGYAGRFHRHLIVSLAPFRHNETAKRLLGEESSCNRQSNPLNVPQPDSQTEFCAQYQPNLSGSALAERVDRVRITVGLFHGQYDSSSSL